ncbi:MAG TPA: alpha/beta hydrolase [Flavobacteriaceae bacterium]|nr:alpha/beta hydrolase [Flavobacteriaceae bacterium]
MKKTLLFALAMLTSLSIYAQDITGQWHGLLKVQGIQLPIVFHISESDGVYSATMDSPDQGAFGIPVATTTYEEAVVKLEISSAAIQYTGSLDENNRMVGRFKQGGIELPLDLSREAIEKEVVRRPQEPTKPYPYYSEDVVFHNHDANVALAGTLTLPEKEGIYPVVILITGSGPQNRDEEIAGHKPFLVISDYLTRKGIGVLRFDDRGVGESTGNFATATSADFATDVESAIAYLKTREEVDKTNIGLLGHSEGGLIAPMVASKSTDVAFLVLLAAPGIRVDELMMEQAKQIGKAMGLSEETLLENAATNRKIYDLMLQSESLEELEDDVTSYLSNRIKEDSSNMLPEGMNKEEFISMQVAQIASPWMRYFIAYDPAPVLEKVTCPVLALNGEKDLQVTPKENLEGIRKALEKGGNPNATVKELANLNHLFQESITGSPDEYGSIEETFSTAALQEIADWIIKQVK